MLGRKGILILLALFLPGLANPGAAWQAARSVTQYDIVIKHGHIIDGTGSPWYAADIGISNGRIAGIGNLESAQAGRVIDADGMVVAPGFIDMLGQSELTILVNPHLPSKIFQGITPEMTAEADSAAPFTPAPLKPNRISSHPSTTLPDSTPLL